MDWDQYWLRAKGTHRRGLYEVVAQFYRDQIISPEASRVLLSHFTDSSSCRYLHAGCGSGGSDGRIRFTQSQFHLVDFSPVALGLHRQQPLPFQRRYVCGDILRLPYASESMDGIFNLGVMEHFTKAQIGAILMEFHRVLKRTGKLILFWPPKFGLSVVVLSTFLWAVNRFRREPLKLYPDEITRIPSLRWVRHLMENQRFRVLEVTYGWRDLFTNVAVVAEKPIDANS